jgi:hypothetical protein
MAPGVIHLVFTIKDALCVGGHFYAMEQMRRSLWSGVEEACLGQSNTNTQHLCAEEILHRVIKAADSRGLLMRGLTEENWRLGE